MKYSTLLFLILFFPLLSCAQHNIEIKADASENYIIKFSIKNNSDRNITFWDTELPWAYHALGTIEFSFHGVAPNLSRLVDEYPEITAANYLGKKIVIPMGETIEGEIPLQELFPKVNDSKYSDINIFWTYYLDACDMDQQFINTGLLRLRQGKMNIVYENTESSEITEDNICEEILKTD